MAAKKRNKFIIATEILMIIFCAAILFTVLYLKDVANSGYKGNIKSELDIEELNDGWKEITSEGKVDFNNFGKKIEQEELVIEHDLYFASESMDSFAFSTYYSAVKVEIVDNDGNVVEELEKYGDKSSFEENKLLGNRYSIVHIPHEINRTNTLRITFINANNEIYLYGFEYGVEGDLTKAVFAEYFSVIVTVILSLVFILALVVLKISKRTGKYLALSHVYFTIFFFTCAIWELLDSQYLMLLGLPAGSVCLASFELYMLLPIALIQFTYAVCKWKKAGKVIDVLLCLFVFLNFLATNAAVFMGYHTFIDILISSHILVFVALLNSLIQLLLSWIRSFNPTNEEIYAEKKFLGYTFLGEFVFAILCVIQLFAFLKDPSKSNTEYLRSGILFFGFIVIINIIRRVNDSVEAERKENLNRIWDEKQKVEDIRLIMNEAFKTIIPEQYIEEVIEAYKKRNKIKNDSVDGTVPEEDLILKIGHSRRLATILVSDVRGFSEISTKYDQRVGDMLSHYLGTMTDIIEKYGGHVLEFMGDGILAGFGVIEQDKYQADNAVKAAIEMQSTMAYINEWNESNGFPGQLEIGIGINTGNVFAGIIGSLERFKFDVLGREVNLASRIESFTTGGQVLIAQKTKESIIEPVGTYDIIKATPKGFDTEQTYYLVNAVGDMKYEVKGEDFKTFKNPVDVKFSVFEDKGNTKKTFSGVVTEMSEHAIILKTTALLDIFDIVKVIHNGGVTCKVTKIEERGYTLRFTSSNKRNDGRPIFEDIDPEPTQYSELDPETIKLLKKKQDDYTF